MQTADPRGWALLATVVLFVTCSANAEDKKPATAKVSAKPTAPFTVGPALQEVSNDEIEKAYEGKRIPEAIRMYLAISRGGRMGSGDGWFGPAKSRYGWEWLAERHGNPEGGIDETEFRGSAKLFRRLDRNIDGKITPDDLDWSDRNTWVQNAYLVNRLFRKSDPNGDGELSREEWLAFFDSAAKGKSGLTSDDLRDAWLAGFSSNFLPGDAPTKEILLQGLFTGEVGSLQEGPMPDEPAPDFTLKTQDAKQTIQLSKVIGAKPVVLVFGNFTCAPFRSMYPGVETISQRFKDEAVFLGIYVREAHPTDGWKMESNARVGVAVAQPKTYAERTTVAQQCHQLLKPTIPLLVDEIDDSTGNAYSGMPARLYVIDTAGRIAYQSGRGPFGFKSGEMEQALVMTLLDETPRGQTSSVSGAANKGRSK